MKEHQFSFTLIFFCPFDFRL